MLEVVAGECHCMYLLDPLGECHVAGAHHFRPSSCRANLGCQCGTQRKADGSSWVWLAAGRASGQEQQLAWRARRREWNVAVSGSWLVKRADEESAGAQGGRLPAEGQEQTRRRYLNPDCWGEGGSCVAVGYRYIEMRRGSWVGWLGLSGLRACSQFQRDMWAEWDELD